MLKYFSTALGGYDYRTVSSGAIFTSGSMNNDTRCLNITIIDDNALEGVQSFTMMLTASDPDVVLGNDVMAMTIIDNDGTINSLILCCIVTINSSQA